MADAFSRRFIAGAGGVVLSRGPSAVWKVTIRAYLSSMGFKNY
jgi:hypothetical protein